MQSQSKFRNLVDMLIQRAATRTHATMATFVSDHGNHEGQMTFGELDAAARRIGALLVQRGFAGRNLLLLYPPGLDYIKAFFACLYAGCVPVPAYPPTGARDLTRLYNVALDCNAGAVLSNDMLTPVITSWVENLDQGIDLPCIATDSHCADDDAIGFIPHQADPDDIAFLQYTSGSTGHPKGVMVSHGNLLANFEQILQGFLHGNPFVASRSELEVVIWLPPFHDMGLIGGVLTPIYAGAHVSLMSPLTFLKRPFVWLKTISEQRAQVSGGPNFCYEYAARKVTDAQLEQLDLSRWQVAFNGAEPIQAGAMQRFAQRFQSCGFNAKAFLPCYGLAEASLFVAGTPSGNGVRTLGAQPALLQRGRFQPATTLSPGNSIELVSSGVTAIGTDVRIVDPATLLPCADGTVGEIWVRSPSVAKGYWGKPHISASVFEATCVGDGAQRRYLRTGDLGFLCDAELYVTGRIKELIIVGGRNLYPQDIEKSLQDCNPAFRRGGGAAFALTQDEQEHLVVLQELERSAAREAVDYQLLAAAAAREIAARHGVTPHQLVLVPASTIPKTSSGKLQRNLARQLYQEGNFAPLHVWQATREIQTAATVIRRIDEDNTFTDWHAELHATVQAWVAQKLDLEAHYIDLDVTFSELGVNSVEAVELVELLQDRMQRNIPATELLRFHTVQALIRHFAEELQERALTRLNDAEESTV